MNHQIVKAIQPVFKWPGGKRKQAKRLIELMPEHKCFLEVFFGGGALFFARGNRAKCEVINDANGELINLYDVIKHDLDGLLNELQWQISARELFKRFKTADLSALNEVRRAARFLFLQQHSFGGKVTGQTFGTDTTCGAPNFESLKLRLVAAHSRLNGVYVENLDWRSCIGKYDRKHTFAYFDPPYWKLAGYGMQFDWPEYVEMAEVMASADSKIMLSINDHPDIRNLFGSFRTEEVAVRYTNGGAKSRRNDSVELIICNW